MKGIQIVKKIAKSPADELKSVKLLLAKFCRVFYTTCAAHNFLFRESRFRSFFFNPCFLYRAIVLLHPKFCAQLYCRLERERTG